MERFWNRWIGRPKSAKRTVSSAKSGRKRSTTRRRLKPEALEARQLLAANIFHNELMPEDVNEDGVVSSLDALTIINRMSRQSQGDSLVGGGPQQRGPGQMTDVNNDGQDSAIDALMVINRLNRDRRGIESPIQRLGPQDGPNQPGERPTDDPTSDLSTKVRSIDGTGNNLENPEFGATDTELLRVAENDYADGISEPAGEDRPSARQISNTLSAADPEGTTSERNLSSFVFAWGQFLDHDITLSLEPDNEEDAVSFDIEVPEGDVFFDPFGTGEETIHLTRSAIADGTGTSTDNPAEQVNSITANVDGSQVYGSDQETSDSLRSFVGGRLLVTDDGLMPTDEDGEILAGDIRAAENVVLTSMHALFVREHNRLADEISFENPDLSDEEVFQEARGSVIAEMQSITYNEYLPALLGEDALSQYGGYDSSVDPGIAHEFSTAAFRFGHSTLNDEFRLVGNDGEDVDEPLSLAGAFFVPELLEETGIDSFLKYASSTLSQEIDLEVVDSLRNFLFGPPGAGGFDLVSLNIQRGRDHGLADYNATREAYGLDPAQSFADVTSNEDVQANLESLYGNVNNIDLWVGLLAEDHTENGSLGETATTIIADQFERLRDGDRFYYANTMNDREVREIESTTLADIIERNTNLDSLQSNVFFFAPEITGTVVAESATPQQSGATELVLVSSRELVPSRDPGGPSNVQQGGPELQLGEQQLGGQQLGGQPQGGPQQGTPEQGSPQRPGQPQRGPEMGAPDDRVVAAEGIIVELVDSEGNIIDSVLTDANGKYAFDSVTQSGSYQVRVAESDEWDVAGNATWDLSISNGDEDMDRIDFRVVV
jgi:peroxidase